MSIFGDLDVASAEDNPFAIPDNMYEAYVTDAKVALTKAGDKLGLTLTYTIDGGPENGKQVSEFKHIPRSGDIDKNGNVIDAETTARAASFLKMRLASLGVPETKMNELDPVDLIGTPCTVVVKTANGYTNVNKVTVREDTEPAF